jgi:superfamily II DNA/RNA helicase
VVLFDFPHTMVDYLHRLGRTGRVGSAPAARCRASVLMTHRRDVRTAWQIKDAAEKREAIMNHKMNRRLQSLS